MNLFIKELFINICMMFTLLFWCGQVVYKQQNFEESSIKMQIKVGCITGIFGCILILFRMSFFGNIYIDYRSVAIVLSALYGGLGAVMITGGIMGLFRLLIHGVSFVSMVATISILVAAVGCGFFVRIESTSGKKWAILYSYTTLCTLVGVLVVMRGDWLLDYTIFTLIMMNSIGGGIGYWLYKYLRKTEESYMVLKSQVHIDSLTKLYNRRYFEVVLEDQISKMKNSRKEDQLTLIMFDIDHFKRINDTYGHLSGDEVLKQLAEICKKCVPLPATLYRVGGEEFAVIIPWNTYESAENIAEHIRMKIKSHPFLILNDEVIRVTVSLGIATYPEVVYSPYDLFASADEALYEAKETGRNRSVSFKNLTYKNVQQPSD